MLACRITFRSGQTTVVRGELQSVLDELHKVATRREQTFAIFEGADGQPIAMPPDAVLYVRPESASDDAAPSGPTS